MLRGSFVEVLVFLFLEIYVRSVFSWDPDAGYVRSWTKMTGVTANATSGSDSVLNVLDNDDNTQWMSGSCLPSGYVSQANQNMLFGACGLGLCTNSSGNPIDITKITDGSVYTLAQLNTISDNQGNHRAKFSLQFQSSQEIHLLSVWGIYNSQTSLYAVYQNGKSEMLLVLQSSDNYKQVTINRVLYNVAEIYMESNNSFQVKEISSLAPEGCKESVTVDLGALRKVGTIRTRHWAGSNAASQLTLQFSVDMVSWTTITTLVPDALHGVTTGVIPPKVVKFIKLEYTLISRNYNKVYCWEISAWDSNQGWGKPIVGRPQLNTIREILGVNGIWGWQHSTYSSSLKPGEGPDLYNAVALHARNYHNLDWDITDTSKDPHYDKMANGHGTQAKGWLNWDLEYRAWRNSSLIIEASIQFTNKSFPENNWSNPEQEAFNFGQHFAHHFGADQGNGLIDAVEIGNEPWDYDAIFYNKVLKGMSAGLRSADSRIKILPGAFQAHEKYDNGNYIGTRLTENVATNISIVNFHTYSYRTDNNGNRIATYPEHQDSTFNSIRNIVRWRDINLPTKPIWVTEWGWDADGSGENCSFPECVSEEAQALYGIRGLLILARSNVQKVTWFFYANSQECQTLYCRSGLTASIKQNFAKKSVFYAFEALHRIIGNKYFLGILQEDSIGYVYAFSSSPFPESTNSTTQNLLQFASHLVGWKPVDASDSSTSTIQLSLPQSIYPSTSSKFSGQHCAITDIGVPHVNGNVMTLELSSHPIVVELAKINSGNIVG